MRHYLPTMIALPAALLFACAASAQMRPQTTQPQPQTPPQQMPQTQPMPQTQTPPAIPATTQTRQCANGSNCYDNNTTDRDTNGGMRSFSSLAGSKGYVTQPEARSDQWLSRHFNQCDRNQDGKVTRSEYQRCHGQNATGGQP